MSPAEKRPRLRVLDVHPLSAEPSKRRPLISRGGHGSFDGRVSGHDTSMREGRGDVQSRARGLASGFALFSSFQSRRCRTFRAVRISSERSTARSFQQDSTSVPSPTSRCSSHPRWPTFPAITIPPEVERGPVIIYFRHGVPAHAGKWDGDAVVSILEPVRCQGNQPDCTLASRRGCWRRTGLWPLSNRSPDH